MRKNNNMNLSNNTYTEKYGLMTLLCILVFICIIVFNQFLLFFNVYIFKDIGSDSYNHAYPVFIHVSEYLRNEGIPQWSFSQGMGQNIFPGGISNPFCLILYLLGKNQLAYGIAYVEVLKILICGIFFYLYLQTLLQDKYISIIGAILCSFSGYIILGSGWYRHSLFVTYGVFLLFSFEKLFKQKVWIYFPLSVALIGAFSTFYLFMFGLFIFFYSMFRYADEYKFEIKGLLLLYVKLGYLTLLGISMVFIFMFNDLQRMLQSPRVGGEAGYFNKLLNTPIFTLGSFEHYITALFRLFSNDILGTGSQYKGWFNYLEAPEFYCGLITILLVPQLFFIICKQKRIIFSIFLVFWGIIVILPFFRYSFYLFSGDYYKGGLSFFIPIVLLYYSLFALKIIIRKNVVNIPILISTFFALLLILYFPYFPENNNIIVPEIQSLVASFLVLYTILIFLLSVKKYKSIAKLALLITICVEVTLFSYITVNKRFVVSSDELHEKVGYNDYTIEALKYIQSHDKGFFRINKDYASGISIHTSLNDALVQGFYGTSSYCSFNQHYYIKFLSDTGVIQSNNEFQTRWAQGLITRPFLQTLASIKYNLSKREDAAYLKLGYEKIKAFNDVHVLKNKNFLPLGFTYDKYISYKHFMQLSTFKKEIILLRSAVIHTDDKDIVDELNVYNITDIPNRYTLELYQEDIQKLKNEVFTIKKHSHNHIKGTIHLTQKKLLFFSIPYDKGWIATVDGKTIPLKLVNSGFMGLLIDKGAHAVELRYTIPGGTIGIIISLLFFFIYMICLYAYYKKFKILNQ